MRSWKDMSRGLKVMTLIAVVAALVMAGLYVTYRVQTAGDPDGPRRASVQGQAGATAATALKLGATAPVGSDYRVAVTDVTAYEMPRLPFLAVRVESTYLGQGEGEPVTDLIVQVVSSSDSRSISGSSCPIVFDGLSDRDLVSFGDLHTQVVCFSLSQQEGTSRTISVAGVSAPQSVVYWSTGKVAIGELPSATPTPPVTRSPISGARPPATGGSGRAKACDDFDDDKVDDYRKWGDDVKDWYKDHPGARDDDYEDWVDAYEKRLKQFEEWAERC